MNQDTQFGDLFGDALNAITHPADTVSGAVNQVGDIVTHPGDDINTVGAIVTHPADSIDSIARAGAQYAQASLDVYKFMGNNLSDFAKSSLGKTLLDIMAGAAYMALVLTTGPIAYLVFSVPGLIRGENFQRAFLEGMFAQAQRVIKIFGGDVNLIPPDVAAQVAQYTSAFTSQVGDVSNLIQSPDIDAKLAQLGMPSIDSLKQKAIQGVKDSVNKTVSDLSDKLQKRADAVYAALDAQLGATNPDFHQAFVNAVFDPVTGKQMIDIRNPAALKAAGLPPLQDLELKDLAHNRWTSDLGAAAFLRDALNTPEARDRFNRLKFGPTGAELTGQYFGYYVDPAPNEFSQIGATQEVGKAYLNMFPTQAPAQLWKAYLAKPQTPDVVSFLYGFDLGIGARRQFSQANVDKFRMFMKPGNERHGYDAALAVFDGQSKTNQANQNAGAAIIAGLKANPVISRFGASQALTASPDIKAGASQALGLNASGSQSWWQRLLGFVGL